MMRKMSPKRLARLSQAKALVRQSTFARQPGNSTGAGIRPKVRAAVLTRDGYACVRCGAGCLPGGNYSIHHRLSRSLGESDLMSNLITLCGSGTTDCHGAVHERGNRDAFLGYWIRTWDDPLRVRVLYHSVVPGVYWYLHDDGSLEEEPQQ